MIRGFHVIWPWRFRPGLREKLFAEMKQHSLRREIIATQLGKHVTDRMGVNFVGAPAA